MSKISLASNASGTGIFTIASPATNTNRTLTLPDTTGTLLDTNGGTITGTLTVTGVTTLGNGAVLGVPASGTVTNLTGTASININGTVGATTATTGAFTTLSASSGNYTSTGGFLLGADIGATTVTNATRKAGIIAVPHYTNAASKVMQSWVDADSAANIIYYGGGLAGFNAATQHIFKVGATTTTGDGSVVATISSTGLAVTGTLSATGNATFSGGTATVNNLVNTVGQAATLNLTTFNTNFGSSNTLQLLTTLNNATTGASTSTFKQFNHNQGSDDVFITKTSGDAGYLAISTGTGAAEVARFTTTGLAVTGALSATGNANFGNAGSSTYGGYATGGRIFSLAAAGGVIPAISASTDTFAGSTAFRAYTKEYANDTSYAFEIQTGNGTGVTTQKLQLTWGANGLWNSTGLAVTGTLSATGMISKGTTTGAPAAGDDLVLQTTGYTGITLFGGAADASTVYFRNQAAPTVERGYLQYDFATSLMTSGSNTAVLGTLSSTGNLSTTGNFTAGSSGNGGQVITTLQGYSPNSVNGSYGSLLFSANTNYTGGAGRYLLTNALDYTKFAIICSADATTTPTLDVNGAVSSGVAAFVIKTNATAIFSSAVSVGNATPTTSGAGITFPASQNASSDANTLDDYEEGTFTLASNFTITGALTQSNAYVKIGRQVTLNYNFNAATSIACTAGSSFLNLPPFETAYDGTCLAANLATDLGLGVGAVEYSGGSTYIFPPSFTSGANQHISVTTTYFV